jgi:polar amino acid transport system substrate-binding protein
MLRIVLTLVACLSFFQAANAEQTVRLMANTSPPYSDDKLPERGLALELVEHIFSRTDYTPDISIDSWSRALEGVSIGVYDALAAAWYTEERNEEFMFSEPYLDSKLIILKARSTTARPRSLGDLTGARIGVRADYAYGVDLSQIPNVQLVEENHLIQNLLNLLNGRVHFVIGDKRTVIFQLNEYLKGQIHKFSVVDIDLEGRQRHVAASRAMKGNTEMIKAFNKALAETRKDGSYDAIIKKWDERHADLN